MFGYCLLAVTVARAEPRLLTSVEQIRSLTAAEAERNLPVELEGTVIYYDGHQDHAFLQDPTGSIFFRPGRISKGEPQHLALNELVRIKGVTIRGSFSPSVAGAGASSRGRSPIQPGPVAVTRLGDGERPPPVEVTGEDLLAGAYHDQFVRIRGTVRSHSVIDYLGEQRLVLGMSLPRVPWLLRVIVPRMTILPEKLTDIPCEVFGIVAGGGDEHGRLQDVRLLAPSMADIRYDWQALELGFHQAAHDPGDVMKYDTSRRSAQGAGALVKVEGVVTLAVPGQGFYLGRAGEGLWIQSLQISSVRKGDEVRALGFPSRDGQRVFLDDGIFNVMGHDRPLAAWPLDPAEAVSGNYISALVSVEGELLDEVTQANERIMFLAASGRRFTAKIAQERAGDLPKAPPRGSWLRVSGILESGGTTGGIGSNVSAFSLLARDKSDIETIHTPSWFTADRLKLLQIVTLAVVTLGMLWLWLLRRQVAHQSQLIKVQTAERTLIVERQRIARELHDTLEQQLAGIRYHLNALNDWSKDAPLAVVQTVAATRAMLDHSSAEMRRSVFELRSPVLEEQGLVGAVRQTSGVLAPGGTPVIEVIVEGNEHRLDRRTEFHLMRVVQEIVTNAVKHANATLVTASFKFGEDLLRIDVADDGIGFDPKVCNGSALTKFGMLGIRERLGKIQGEMEIESQTGEGTRISVTVAKKRKVIV